jgi:hypothetical protein
LQVLSSTLEKLSETAGRGLAFTLTGGFIASSAEESGKWALRSLQCYWFADSGVHAGHESRSEGLPLGSQTKIVIKSLVLKEHVFVGPVRSNKLRIHVDCTNELFSSAHLNGLVHGKNAVKSLTSRHLLQSLLQIKLGWVLDRACV